TTERYAYRSNAALRRTLSQRAIGGQGQSLIKTAACGHTRDAMPSHSTHPTPSRSKASLLLDGGGRPQLLENDPLHHRHERTMPFHIVVPVGRVLPHR